MNKQIADSAISAMIEIGYYIILEGMQWLGGRRPLLPTTVFGLSTTLVSSTAGVPRAGMGSGLSSPCNFKSTTHLVGENKYFFLGWIQGTSKAFVNGKEIQFVDGGSNVGLQYKEITRSTISLNGSWSESNFFTTKISFLNFSDYVNIFITIQLQIEYVRDSTGSGSNVYYGWQESDENSSSGQFWMTSNGVSDISGVIMYSVLQITYNTNYAI